jgi:hypothetical protein
MINFLNDDNNIDLTTREKALETITNMHNTVCNEFGIVPQTTDEAKALFMKNFDNTNYSKLIRAHQIREEDHIKMKALQTEINGLKKKHISNNTSNDCEDNTQWKNATIALSVILALLFLILITWCIQKRFNYLKQKSKPKNQISTFQSKHNNMGT